nr:hypothetical protein [Tanacetum cinerariifolium]
KGESVTEGLSDDEKDIIKENLIAFADPKAPDFVLPRQEPPKKGGSVTEGSCEDKKEKYKKNLIALSTRVRWRI